MSSANWIQEGKKKFSNLQICFGLAFKDFWGICVFFGGGREISLLLNVNIIDTTESIKYYLT